MFRSTMRRWFSSLRTTQPIMRSRRLRLQPLEERAVPATYTVNDDGDTGTGSGFEGDLRWCIEQANANSKVDTILFDLSYPATINLTQGALYIATELYLEGPDNSTPLVTIVGDGSNRVFELETALPLGATFSDLQIEGGVAGENGGGILLREGRLSLFDCVITGNTAENGGGIYAQYGFLTMENCLLTTNIAKSNGGGIGALDVELTLGNDTNSLAGCTLSANEASGKGSGICIVEGSLTARDSFFENNFAMTGSTDQGGAIYSETKTTLDNCDFLNNFANYGGAIEVATAEGALIMDSCDFDVGGSSPSIEGGAIRLVGVSTTVTSKLIDTTIKEGYATLYGGGIAIFDQGKIEITGDKGTISQCRADNSGITPATQGMGGAIYIGQLASGSSVLIQDITFHALAPLGGGSALFGNGALFGGAIGIEELSGWVTIEDCHMDLNGTIQASATDGKGGAIYVTGASSPGKVMVAGGTIGGDAVADVGFTFPGYSNNSVIGGGVCIDNTNTEVIFDSVTIAKNIASDTKSVGDGGGIAIINLPNVLIKNCTISENEAPFGVGGGFLYGIDSDSVTTNVVDSRIQNSTIYGNKATKGGGTFVDGSPTNSLVEFFNVTITANEATLTSTTFVGGGIALANFTGGDSIYLDSTIVAMNISDDSTDDSGPDIGGGGVVDAHFSLIGIAGAKGGGFDQSSWKGDVQSGTVGSGNAKDPGFDNSGALVNDGGPTKVVVLLSGGNSINKGRNFLDFTGIPFDQRGSGYYRTVGKQTDVGAYKLQGAAAATISKIVVNDTYVGPGPSPDPKVQRSRVLDVTVYFDQEVELPHQSAIETAFQLQRQSDSKLPPLIASAVVFSNATVVTLTFPITGDAIDTYSLADGRYTLTVFAEKVSSGNFKGDTTVGDDYVLVGAPGTGPGLFRIFGDFTGEGTVNYVDFGYFSTAYGGNTDPEFDFDGNGWVQSLDYAAFRLRYGVSI